MVRQSVVSIPPRHSTQSIDIKHLDIPTILVGGGGKSAGLGERQHPPPNTQPKLKANLPLTIAWSLSYIPTYTHLYP